MGCGSGALDEQDIGSRKKAVLSTYRLLAKVIHQQCNLCDLWRHSKHGSPIDNIFASPLLVAPTLQV